MTTFTDDYIQLLMTNKYNITSIEQFKSVKKITFIDEFFKRFSSLQSIKELTFDVSECKSFNNVFEGCYKLIDISSLNRWNVSNSKSFNETFLNCFSLRDISSLSSWDVSNSQSFRGMFKYCSDINSFDAIRKWNISKANDISSMFFKTRINLESISNFDVSNVENFSDCFGVCNVLDVSYIKDWNMTNSKNLMRMFILNNELINISSLKRWDVSNACSFSEMFAFCNIEDISFISSWNINEKADLTGMFKGNFISNLELFRKIYKNKSIEEIKRIIF